MTQTTQTAVDKSVLARIYLQSADGPYVAKHRDDPVAVQLARMYSYWFLKDVAFRCMQCHQPTEHYLWTCATCCERMYDPECVSIAALLQEIEQEQESGS